LIDSVSDLANRTFKINDVIYEVINGDFWWGQYDDFKVIIMKSKGFINATKLCSDNNKELKNWDRNAATKTLIETFKNGKDDSCWSYKVKAGGGKKASQFQVTRGTYIHTQLMPSIIRWVLPEYALHLYNIINNYILSITMLPRLPKPALPAPKKSIIDSTETVSLVSYFEPESKPQPTLCMIYKKNTFMADPPGCSSDKISALDDLPWLMYGYKDEKSRKRHLQKIKKSYPSASCVISDMKLKPDMKNFKKFLKKHKIVSKLAHVDAISQSIFDLY